MLLNALNQQLSCHGALLQKKEAMYLLNGARNVLNCDPAIHKHQSTRKLNTTAEYTTYIEQTICGELALVSCASCDEIRLKSGILPCAESGMIVK